MECGADDMIGDCNNVITYTLPCMDMAHWR